MTKHDFQDLAKAIADADPEDQETQTGLIEQLKSLRDRPKLSRESELFRHLDAASLLTGFLGKVDEQQAAEVRRVVAALVRAAENAPEEPGEELIERTEDGVRRIKAGTEPKSGLRLINEILLGDILVQLGKVTRQQVREAVEQQKLTGMPLGLALIEIKAATVEDIEHGLRFQNQLQSSKSAERTVTNPGQSLQAQVANDLLLGETLVRLGLITEAELKAGLHTHHAAGVRIGEALVQNGAATWEQIEKGLSIQAVHRG